MFPKPYAERREDTGLSEERIAELRAVTGNQTNRRNEALYGDGVECITYGEVNEKALRQRREAVEDAARYGGGEMDEIEIGTWVLATFSLDYVEENVCYIRLGKVLKIEGDSKDPEAKITIRTFYTRLQDVFDYREGHFYQNAVHIYERSAIIFINLPMRNRPKGCNYYRIHHSCFPKINDLLKFKNYSFGRLSVGPVPLPPSADLNAEGNQVISNIPPYYPYINRYIYIQSCT